MISNELLKQKILDEAIHGRLVKNDLTLEPIDVEEVKEDIPFEIPNNWRWTKIKKIGSVIGGGTPNTQIKKYWNGNISWITPADMKSSAKEIGFGKNNITEIGLKESSAKLMPKGTIIISSRAPIGYVKISLNDISTSQGCKSIIPFEIITSDYLYYYIKSIKKYLDSIGTGATFREISGKKLSEVLIALPPLEEQKRIVDKIEKLFNLIEKKEINDNEIEKLKRLLKDKILYDSIHGRLIPNDLTLERINKEEIKDNEPFKIPKNWKWCELEKICKKIYAGGDKTSKFSKNKTNDYKIPVIANGKENDGIIGYTDIPTETEKSLTISGRGTIGFSLVRNYSFSPVVRLIVIKPIDNINLNYLKYVMDVLLEVGKGTSIPQLTIPMIKNKLIPVPPLEEQKRIVEKIENLFALIDKL